MTRNSLERRKVFWGRLTSLSVIAFVVALALLSAACNNVNLAGKGGGIVSLTIDEVLASEIRSAGEPLRQTLATGTTYTVKARLSGGHTADTSITVDSGNLAGAALSFEGIPVGVTVRLDLEVRAGNNLVWIGSTVDDYTVESGENPLTVNVGRVSGVLLWGGGSRQILIAPYGSYGSPEKLEYENPADEGIAFCFDNEGNVYVQMGTDKPVNKYKIQQDGTYNATPDALASDESGQYTFSHLSYDNKTGVLYGITDTQLIKLTTSVSEQITDFSIEGITPDGFAVHNGFVYVADSSSSSTSTVAVVNFYEYDVENKNLSLRNTITLPEVFASTNNYASVSQMIYQEGALYLLLGCVKDSTPNISSVGAIAKIDAKTLTLDTSFGQDGYLGLVSTKREVSYKDSSGQDQSYSVYAAGTSDEEVFSKPLGFVAIMPKKLVIADAGCIVSEEIVDQGGVYKLKGDAVSRIVTVDLETQSLGFKDLDPNQYYWTGNPLGSSVEISSDTSSGTSSSSF